MDIIVSIIFGIVQGLTEFIPVSSSGHLLLLHALLPNALPLDDVSFDVALHVGTLLALLGFFWNEVWLYLGAWFQSMGKMMRGTKPAALTFDEQLSWYLIIAIIPAGLVGFFFESLISIVLRSPYIVVVMLVVIGIVFFYVEKWAKGRALHTIEQTTAKQALAIGLAQVLALVPGTSRSGITIIAGMFTGFKRADAARFSFLMSMPIVAAAGLKKGIDLASMGVTSHEFVILLAGALSAAIVGYIAIATLLKYLSHRSLAVFGWYRIILALVMLVTLPFIS